MIEIFRKLNLKIVVSDVFISVIAICSVLAASCASSSPEPPLMSLRDRAETKLLLVGADGTQLGCLSCDSSDPASITVRVKNISSESARDSIRNHQGPFGSATSPTSACNPVATNPPVIVDSEGHRYGRLTLNPTHPEAMKDDALRLWLRSVCTAGTIDEEPEPDCGCAKSQ